MYAQQRNGPASAQAAGAHPLDGLTQPPAAPPARPGVAISTPATSPADAIATVRLSRPLKTHRGDVVELALRQPTLTDYIEVGDIDTFTATGLDGNGQPTGMEARTSHANLMAYAVRLSGIDAHILGTLPPADAGNVIRAVRLMVLPFSRGNSLSGSTS